MHSIMPVGFILPSAQIGKALNIEFHHLFPKFLTMQLFAPLHCTEFSVPSSSSLQCLYLTGIGSIMILTKDVTMIIKSAMIR